MIFKSNPNYISRVTIETGLWAIQRYLIDKYGIDQSRIDVEPLAWYIQTGRAPLDFIRKVLTAKPFMVARKLHEGGSYDEVIRRVKDYIGFEEV